MVVLGTFIIMCCVMAGTWTALRSENSTDSEDGAAFAIGSLVFGPILTALAVLFGGLFTQEFSGHEKRYDLAALSLATDVSGEFFLGIGGFGNDATFYSYIGNDEKGYKLYEFDAENVRIAELDTDETPYLIADCGSDEYDTWVTWPLAKDDQTPDCHLDDDDVTFYVPKGSIVSKVDIALPGMEN